MTLKRLPDWRFGTPTEDHFEPLLALRVAVMREHLERVGRYTPERSRRVFRDHFNEPGLRLILTGPDTLTDVAGCVGFRRSAEQIKLDSFYLHDRHHNTGLGTAILAILLAEADTLALPIRLEVLTGSQADRFYLRHGFVKLSEDAVEGHYERPAPKIRALLEARDELAADAAAKGLTEEILAEILDEKD